MVGLDDTANFQTKNLVEGREQKLVADNLYEEFTRLAQIALNYINIA